MITFIIMIIMIMPVSIAAARSCMSLGCPLFKGTNFYRHMFVECVYIAICIAIVIYIYIYIERERDNVYIYIYRERETVCNILYL